MKIQAASLALLTAFGAASAEKTRRLRRNGSRFQSKGRSRNAQSIFFPPAPAPTASPTPDPYIRPDMKNVLFLMADDLSADRFPEAGNGALVGKIPGIQELKDDGAVWYPNFNTAATVCAPSQASLTAGIEPGNFGAQNHMAGPTSPAKIPYRALPPPEVQFIPEKLRSLGYWSVGGGKLDYQVAETIPTFYNEIDGAPFVNIMTFVEKVWTEAKERSLPFFGMVNMMDNHEQLTSLYSETPIFLTDSITQEFPDLPNGKFGYATNTSLSWRPAVLTPGSETTSEWVPTHSLDLLNVDITGYNGDYDETTLIHADGSLPTYVVEEIGVQSIFAREYDLIRNMDWKISNVIKRLKEEDLYDHTLIMVFGDHGSGDYKGKVLLQPQSVNSPMWIKYPMDVPLSSSVQLGADGYNEDIRLFPAKDVYPTVLSTIGVKPGDWMDGLAKGGEFETVGFDYESIHSLVARVSVHFWKSFAGYNREFYYVNHKLNKEAINAREALNLEPASTFAKARNDMLYGGRYSTFGKPLFDRMTRLMYINAENPSYPDAMRFITHDSGAPPAEVLFDLRVDPHGTNNLLVETTYTPIYGDEMQSWGNFVEKIESEYGPVDTSGLDADQLAAYTMLKQNTVDWVDSLSYVTQEIDWADGLVGEENKMAETFWPTGTQEKTATPMVDETGAVTCETEGAMMTYTALNDEQYAECDRIGRDGFREGKTDWSPLTSGLPIQEYVAVRNGNTYSGYLWGGALGVADFDLSVTFFMGFVPGTTVFISEDGTFMEAMLPSLSPVAFDTRDGMWNGETQTWDGVDASTGEWTVDPVTLWDDEAGTWNYEVMESYVFGEFRDAIYSGNGSNGFRQDKTPLNLGFNPAPMYWVQPDIDPNLKATFYSQEEFWLLNGWSFEESSNFQTEDEGDVSTMAGSFYLGLRVRVDNINFSGLEIFFSSYDLPCPFWDVGTQVDLGDMTEDMTVLAQAARKGFLDSDYSSTMIAASM